LSIQAFQPVLKEGKAIQLHPLVCKGFNADFDGDQMAVHLPLSEAAQREAREIMAANRNLLKPADGSPILHVEQDIVLGCYYLTYDKKGAQRPQPKAFSSIDEVVLSLDRGKIKLQTPVEVPFRGEIRKTTAGRLLFNEIFPEDFPFQNEAMTSRKLDSVMTYIYQKYGQEKTAEIADELKDLGFRYATASGISIGMDDFSDLKVLRDIVEQRANRNRSQPAVRLRFHHRRRALPPDRRSLDRCRLQGRKSLGRTVRHGRQHYVHRRCLRRPRQSKPDERFGRYDRHPRRCYRPRHGAAGPVQLQVRA
jgi:DNA-directed RNA polymerase beta' subunit